MKIEIELTEKEIVALVKSHLANLLGDLKLDPSRLTIEVKSKQNYKSEWESAAFRARYSHYKPD